MPVIALFGEAERAKYRHATILDNPETAGSAVGAPPSGSTRAPVRVGSSMNAHRVDRAAPASGGA